MKRLSMEEILLEFAKTMVKDLGKEDGRRYLLRNVGLWRKAYGETVANRVIAGIRGMLGEKE